jgi:hypothetical protein
MKRITFIEKILLEADETSETTSIVKNGCKYANVPYISNNPNDYSISDMVSIADGILNCGEYTSGDYRENGEPYLIGNIPLLKKIISEFSFV